MLYYAAALTFGADGLELIRRYADRNVRVARRAIPKSLKMLSGGVSPSEAAWERLQEGTKLSPHDIALVIGLASDPEPGLEAVLGELSKHHALHIKIAIGRGHKELRFGH